MTQSPGTPDDPDEPKEPSLGSMLSSSLSPPQQMIAHALGRVARRAVAEYHHEKLQQEHRNDLLRRQLVEVLARSARAPAPATEATAAPPAAQRHEAPAEDSDTDAELAELAAARARIQRERRLFRARQATARDRIELEQLRRQTEAMEAAVLDVREGRRQPRDVLAQVVEIEPAEAGVTHSEVPVADGPSTDAASTDIPAEDDEVLPVDELAKQAIDDFNLANASLQSHDVAAAFAHADAAIVGVNECLKKYPGARVPLLQLRQAALKIAATACIESGEVLRGVLLLDESIEAAEAVLEYGAAPDRIVPYAHALVLKADVKRTLKRVDEAVVLYESALARLRALADDSPSQMILDLIAQVDRRLEEMTAARRQTH